MFSFLKSLFGKKETKETAFVSTQATTARPDTSSLTTNQSKGKSTMKVDMRKKVSSMQADFKSEFGVNVRVYKGAKFAPDVALKELIPDGFKGGELEVAGNTQVGTLEKKFEQMFGIKIQVEDKEGKLAKDDATLASLKK